MESIVQEILNISGIKPAPDTDLAADIDMGVASFEVTHDFSAKLQRVSSASTVNTGYRFGMYRGSLSDNSLTPVPFRILGIKTKVDIVPNANGARTDVVVNGWISIVSSYALDRTYLSGYDAWDNFYLDLGIVAVGQAI